MHMQELFVTDIKLSSCSLSVFVSQGIFYFEVLDEIVSIRCEAITDYYLTVDENRAVYFDEVS